MIDAEQIWVDEFAKLKPAKLAIEGITNMAGVIEKLTNKVDASLPGATVAPGIFKWNKAAFISQLTALPPTPGPEWAPKIANAWAAACSTGIITPGLVTFASGWQVSTVDTLTAPAGAATIPTIAAGQAAIITALNSIPAMMKANPAEAQKMFAKAFRLGLISFTFTLIGISGTPASPVPTPFPATAI